MEGGMNAPMDAVIKAFNVTSVDEVLRVLYA